MKPISQKSIYVKTPSEYIKDCDLTLAGGFEYDDILMWGVANAKNIQDCNLRLIEARKINDLVVGGVNGTN